MLGMKASNFNPPLAGGGGRITAPLANFLNNLKTSADIDGKLAVPYAASIWHIQQNFSEIRRNLFKKMAF